MRRDHWPLGTWGRVPVTMHWTVLIAFAWMYLVFFDLALTLLAIPFVFLLFVAHEWGHVLMLRRRRIAVTGVSLWGIHGETAYDEYAARPGDAIAVAWSGVAAQLVVMLAALALLALVPFPALPFGAALAQVIYVVLVKINVFVMIIALLPIGPFDGHAAWQVLRRFRRKPRRAAPAKPAAPAPAPKPEPEPEPTRSDEEQQALDRKAEEEAAALMRKLTGRSGANTDDRA